jgi:hypothetical protein
MPRHKDFEIWYDEERQRYRFSVEYWGAYSAPTKKEIEHKVACVRRDVKKRLKEIELENKAYYERIARKEEAFRRMLKSNKEQSKAKYDVRFGDLSSAEQHQLLKMIERGADELLIKNKFDVNSHTIAALRHKRKKNVLKNIQKDETLPDASGCRIVMPSYAKTVIGNRYTGCLRDK